VPGNCCHDDTNVVLPLSNSGFQTRILSTVVGTAQVAPTTLHALGINPNALDVVLAEGTPVLPAVQSNQSVGSVNLSRRSFGASASSVVGTAERLEVLAKVF